MNRNRENNLSNNSTFFSNAQRIFSRIEHIIGHNKVSTDLKIDIIYNIFSDPNGTKSRNQSQRKKLKNLQICGN